MVIDAHVHIYPDKIAEKASESIGAFYDLPMNTKSGSVQNLLRIGEAAGISGFLIHSVATTPFQVESINNFIIRTVHSAPDKFIGFATMHPDHQAPEAELQRAMESGLCGVKLHPDFQKFAIDDERMRKTYTFCEKNGLPILFHTGDTRYNFSSPHLVPRILDHFPNLRLICAHFGGWSQWDEAAECLPQTNVMVDCSSSFYALTDERIKELISAFGEDRIFFGSDFPMWDPRAELERLRSLDLSQEVLRKIESENLIKYLRLNKNA